MYVMVPETFLRMRPPSMLKLWCVLSAKTGGASNYQGGTVYIEELADILDRSPSRVRALLRKLQQVGAIEIFDASGGAWRLCTTNTFNGTPSP